MGLWNSPDIFQEKMNDLLDSLDTVRVYKSHGKTTSQDSKKSSPIYDRQDLKSTLRNPILVPKKWNT
jgi:hypothetical protein